MLGLKMATDPRWVNIVEKNLEEILIDHAFCEQKAASNSISIIVQYPQYPDLVESMVEICKEEMEHFKMVHDKIKERGFKLCFERKDPYVKDLSNFLKKDKINLSKDFYIFTGSTVGVVPILSKGLYVGKIDKLGSVKAIIN